MLELLAKLAQQCKNFKVLMFEILIICKTNCLTTNFGYGFLSEANTVIENKVCHLCFGLVDSKGSQTCVMIVLFYFRRFDVNKIIED